MGYVSWVINAAKRKRKCMPGGGARKEWETFMKRKKPVFLKL